MSLFGHSERSEESTSQHEILQLCLRMTFTCHFAFCTLIFTFYPVESARPLSVCVSGGDESVLKT